MRPVLAGHVPYLALFDGRIHLHDIALLNDAMDVQIENERRAHVAAQKD